MRFEALTRTRSRRFASVLLALSIAVPAHGQAKFAADNGPGASRLDLYGGYGYFHPFSSDINNIPYETVTAGGVFSVAGYFSRHFGVQLEGNFFPKAYNDNDCVYTAQMGPILRFPKGRFIPFFHALGGGAKVGGPANQTCTVWGWGTTGGFGVDYILPLLHDRFAVRPVQGDFSYSRIDNGPLLAGGTGGLGEIYSYRLSTGLVFRLGDMEPRGGSPTLNCSAEPSPVYAGDPVSLVSTGLNLPDSRKLRYQWSASGGVVTGTAATASLDTKGLIPGDYSVSGTLLEGKKDKPIATCTAKFAIQLPPPPTISCVASRAAINSGDQVTITATASSPSGRTLTYSFSTTNGSVVGNGPTAVLSTNGATPGGITVTCTVTDDQGQKASATASTVIATPEPPPPAAAAQTLCSLSFDRDLRRPDRVDNEAKGCLDEVALALNRDPGSKLLMVGHHGAGEAAQNAAERALNARDYLTHEKGIDTARIALAVSDAPGRIVDNTLIPNGAALERGSVSGFDASRITRRGEAYGHGRRAVVHRKARKRARRPRRRAYATLPPP